MMAAVVNGLKYSINRTRPNGHNASFPSGHTATAFTGATLLAHEYGCRSIWIPIAGYTAATATTDAEARDLLTMMGAPFAKEEE